jgi:hypothetical protein
MRVGGHHNRAVVVSSLDHAWTPNPLISGRRILGIRPHLHQRDSVICDWSLGP